MTNLNNAVSKTMNFVFTDIKESNASNAKKRVEVLKANLGKVVNIDISEFITDENIRQSVDEKSESFLKLVESIKKYGILENIVAELRLNKNESKYKLVCIAGHRRILAAKKAKTIKKVPCLLKAFSHEGDKIGASLAENLNREDLHCIDVADGYQGLLSSGWGQEEIAKHFCRDIRTIRHYLKIASWSKEVKQILRKNSQVFSTRVILRQLAYKKYENTDDLKDAIEKILCKPKQQVRKKSKEDNKNFNKQDCKKHLNKYLAQQKLLSSLVKDEIKKAFLSLGLI